MLNGSFRQVEESTKAARHAWKAAPARAQDELQTWRIFGCVLGILGSVLGILGSVLGILGSVNCTGPISLYCGFMCYATYAFCLFQICFCKLYSCLHTYY